MFRIGMWKIPKELYIFLPIVYIVTVFACSYLITSLDFYVEYVFSEHEKKLEASGEAPAEYEDMLEMTRMVIENPVYRMYGSSLVAFKRTRDLGIFILLHWLCFSFIMGKWLISRQYFDILFIFTVILSIGVIFDTVIRIILLEVLPTTSLATWLIGHRYFNPDNLFHFVLARVEVFSLLYLLLISFNLSISYHERPLFVFILTVLCYLTLTILGFLLKFNFSLGPTGL
ncbi:hypothetical protein [Candidatus Kryptonium thompsonii]|nr:hypothetical protein [Candidatus Kryptonium thompsoni]